MDVVIVMTHTPVHPLSRPRTYGFIWSLFALYSLLTVLGMTVLAWTVFDLLLP
jgi:hypothetical protein